jgi:hypothetical protein
VTSYTFSWIIELKDRRAGSAPNSDDDSADVASGGGEAPGSARGSEGA